MQTGLNVRPGDADARLVGVLRLLNALIGIRLRSVSDPESRRHLIWLNDLISAVGLLSQRLASGRLTDFSTYLSSAVDFWKRAHPERGIALETPDQPVALSDLRAACLAIVAHELIGAAAARPPRAGGSGEVSVRLRSGPEGVRLTIEEEGGGSEADSEALEMVRGVADHLGGTVEVVANGRTAVTLALGPDRARSARH